MPKPTRKEVAYILRQWQDPPDKDLCQAFIIRRTVVKTMKMDRIRTSGMVGVDPQTPTEPGMEDDRKSFEDLGILLPPRRLAEKFDAPLVTLMDQYKSGSHGARD